MTRKEFLKAAAGTAAAVGATAQSAATKRNIVFILTDDHRFDFIGAMGHPWLKGRTPNLDRLINEGVHFQNAFVTTSLCSPSRASILSGQYAQTHGVLDNSTALPSGLATFPEILQQHGYTTGFVGKWHMGGESDDRRPGFHHWISFRGQGTYFDPVINFNGDHRKVEGGYITDLLTDEAVQFLDANKERPFFLYLSHKAVHDDFRPAPRHEGTFAKLPVPYPPSYAPSVENYRDKPLWVKRQRNSWHGVDGLYNKRYDFEKFYRDYCESILAVDDGVGRVLETLERNGMLDDTLVVYMGDNGFLHGEHGLVDKRCMYEPSIRVPLMARCPALSPARKVPQMALNIDLSPTFLELAGAPIPKTVQGKSLVPLLKGNPQGWRNEFLYVYFWERAYPQTPTVTGLRTDQYAYMRFHGIWDKEELYDIQKDPHQMNNLLGDVETTTEGGELFNRIQDPILKELVGGLRDRLFRLMDETGCRREPNWREA